MTRVRWAAWFVGGALLAVGVRWVDLHPFVLDARPSETEGSAAASIDAAGIALWVARPEPRPASFGEQDWGHAWTNLLSQEFGAHRVMTVSGPTPDTAEARLVAVTRGGARALTDLADAARRLEGLARDGGIVILEMPPPGPLAALAGGPSADAGIAGDPPLRSGPGAPAWLPPLDALPAPTLGAEADGTFEGHRVPLLRGEWPAMWSRSLDRGIVVGLSFDLGRLLTAWQQGLPGGRFEVADRWSSWTGVDPIQSVDLVADERLLEAAVPFADLLERAVADEIRAQRPFPGWWYVPASAPGAFVLTHDEEAVGDRALYRAEHDASRGHGSTFFVIDRRMTAEGAARIRELGGEVALHWDRGFPERIVRPWIAGPFSPLVREVGLDEQLDALRVLAAPAPIRSHRLHGLLWSRSWAGTFRALEAAGIRVDSSLGPTGDIPPGFPFGTALPYHPLDANGLPFRLREVPFTFQEDERMERGDTARLLAANGALYHGIIVPIFHASIMDYRPSVDRFDEWLGALDDARTERHWIGTFGALLDFLDARDRSRCGVGTLSADRFAADVQAAGPLLSLHVPAETVAGPLREVRVDGRPLPATGWPRPDPHRVLIPLDEGPHRVEASYGPRR